MFVKFSLAVFDDQSVEMSSALQEPGGSPALTEVVSFLTEELIPG